MSALRRSVLCLLIFAVRASPAHAHIGGTVATAAFTSPPPGVGSPPYTFATADTSFTVAWNDGDVDPTGRFYFYYWDHAPADVTPVVEVEAMATPIPEGSSGIWVACQCAADLGVVCPDAGTRDCRNSFTWDTSAVPAGTYWIIASNVDPPFHVYSTSATPVRIAHGGAPLPPAVLILRPSGIGSADLTFHVQWIAVGQPPLHFDLAYGEDNAMRVFGPKTAIGTDVAAQQGSDGTFSYDWDTSAIASQDVFVQVRVTDGTTQTAATLSHQLTIYHPQPSDLGPPEDLAAPAPDAAPPRAASASCAFAPSPSLFAPAVGLALALALVLVARKRSR
jgi:hypothetical protein